MSKERDIEILEYKITEIVEKIAAFKKHGISEKKMENLIRMKIKYEDQLIELKQ
jgi:hypothetical protein